MVSRSIQTDFEFLGFGVLTTWQIALTPLRTQASYIPCWAIVVLTAILPARWMRHRRLPEAGRCRRCGYDLCATPER
ncbi:MAG TPA: hypothetical protein VLI90_16065, partial [Tepidisphaeraceae bacterium]|nr:hypothetical protein [Tepidisphaeraceae bacterium]